MSEVMYRVRCLTVLVLLCAVLGTVAPRPLVAQDPERCRDPRAVCEGFDRFRLAPANAPTWSPQMIRDSGRPIVPVFEGWFQNEDGTYTLSFGYASFNLEEALHIPLGPDNFVEPSEFDAEISELEETIARDTEALKVMISQPATGDGDPLADSEELREIARRLPDLQAHLNRLRDQRARQQGF